MIARRSRSRQACGLVALVCAGLALAACEALIGADFDATHGRPASDPASVAGGAAGGSGREGLGAGGAGRGGVPEPGPRAGLSAGAGGAGDADTDTGTELPVGTRRLDMRGTDAAMVSRRPGLLDLFVLSDGRIEFNRYDGQEWATPEYLGGPDAIVPTARLAAVAAAFNPDRLDLFAVAEDGSIYHWYSSPGRGAVEWFGPEYQAAAGPARPSGGIALASWASQRLDAFFICPSGNLGHIWFEDRLHGVETGDEESIFYLRPSAPVAWASQIKVVSSAFGRLDIFMLAASGRGLLHHWYVDGDGSLWGAPQLPNVEKIVTGYPDDASGVLDELAVANVREGLDLFLRFRGARSEIRRLRYRDGAWATPPGGESISQPEALGLSALSSIFDALSWSPPDLDIFGTDADGRVIDVWLGDYQTR